MISSFAADIIGLGGGVLFIGAFLYANTSPAMNKLMFNVINLIGAVLLLISLSVNFNLPAVLLEVAWAMIAIFGIVKAMRARTQT